MPLAPSAQQLLVVGERFVLFRFTPGHDLLPRVPRCVPSGTAPRPRRRASHRDRVPSQREGVLGPDSCDREPCLALLDLEPAMTTAAVGHESTIVEDERISGLHATAAARARHWC